MSVNDRKTYRRKVLEKEGGRTAPPKKKREEREGVSGTQRERKNHEFRLRPKQP